MSKEGISPADEELEAAQLLMSLREKLMPEMAENANKKHVRFKDPLISPKNDKPLIFSVTKSLKSCLKKTKANKRSCKTNRNMPP